MDREGQPTASHAAATEAKERVNLRDLTRQQLCAWLEDKDYATPQQALGVFKSVWQHAPEHIEALRGVGRSTREGLAEDACISTLAIDQRLESADGTIKFIWRLSDGHRIESVLIPDGDRLTLCISSQVGCAMGCTFCLTGDMGLIRHLTIGEIASQPLQVSAGLPDGQRITNLVFMGMGEPLHNLKALLPALEICLDDIALNFSHRRVTVSTVGLVPKMAELAAALPVNLAVSINATLQSERQRIMPISRKYSLERLMAECRAFPLPSGKRITFEYVMFDGINDTLEDAARLEKLIEGIPSKVNLIPYNPNPQQALQPPPHETVLAFQEHFAQRGITCTVRTTRGLDVAAACGQLGKVKAS